MKKIEQRQLPCEKLRAEHRPSSWFKSTPSTLAPNPADVSRGVIEMEGAFGMML